MSAKNDSFLQIKEMVRIYSNSMYLDRNVRWVLYILAEYILGFTKDYLLKIMNDRSVYEKKKKTTAKFYVRKEPKLLAKIWVDIHEHYPKHFLSYCQDIS